MNFWTFLRWTGAVLFVLVVTVAFLGAGPPGTEAGQPQPRPAPVIVR